MAASDLKYKESKNIKLMIAGILLIFIGMFFPLLTRKIWYEIIFMIRESANIRDSGHLILACATNNFLYAIQSTILFMGDIFVVFHSKVIHRLKRFDVIIITMISNILLQLASYLLCELCWEPVTTIFALLITLFLFERLFYETNSFVQVTVVSIQVFFAFYWLNIMPLFSPYSFGQSEILNSIKNVGIYLNAEMVLNFIGAAFFLPFIISAFITATLFISYSQNINVIRENYMKESKLKDMRAKALEDRIYKEVKSLVHDLKTPLVTIRGLNSLMVTAGEHGKLLEYNERIENSVLRMSEMISSFLYESSRQKLKTTELISYIRAQLPLEDENILFNIIIEDNLPDINVNKIRISRAVINILENAINVPCMHSFKQIKFEVKATEKGISIVVEDNGTGIAESDLPRIWEAGYSTNNTSGLGLPFAKRIIEDNEGSIKIVSLLGLGTRVIITLPAYD